MIPFGTHDVLTSGVDSRRQEGSNVNTDTNPNKQQREGPRKANPCPRHSKQGPSRGLQNMHPLLQPQVPINPLAPFPPGQIPPHMIPLRSVKADSSSANPQACNLGKSTSPSQARPQVVETIQNLIQKNGIFVALPLLDDIPKQDARL
ncbi:hypothetical protein F4774DRAFT_410136 [Daldinia eschscholtzii]|nr:hypothetical protein F4774DRAFT_410136 [Daldinia eschscholtzii]